jgi:hypothetical protein
MRPAKWTSAAFLLTGGTGPVKVSHASSQDSKALASTSEVLGAGKEHQQLSLQILFIMHCSTCRYPGGKVQPSMWPSLEGASDKLGEGAGQHNTTRCPSLLSCMHPDSATAATHYQISQFRCLAQYALVSCIVCSFHGASCSNGVTILLAAGRFVILQLMFVGALVGSGAFGFLCDRWGRRRPLFITTAIVAAAMFASLAAGSCYWAFVVLRVVTGFGAAGQSHCNFLLSTEPVGPNYRCGADCALGGRGVPHTTAAQPPADIPAQHTH